MHLDSYLSKVKTVSPTLIESVQETSSNVLNKVTDTFRLKGSETTGLLLGNVQSGKTVQLIGVITRLADQGFPIFLVLTTDNVFLQEQTKSRLQDSISTFAICGEYDDVTLMQWKGDQPLLIVLKKNTNVLKKWKNLLASSKVLHGRPLVIVDDEADAASLNTLVNKNKISTIHGHLREIKKLSASSLYIQVTATPQANILQSVYSGWKPDFVHYFNPGYGYIGGDLIYSSPKSFTIKFTPENELDEIKEDGDIIPTGLRDSLICFLIICAHFKNQNKSTCNFLVHPSVRIGDHHKFATIIGETLNTFLECLRDETCKSEMLDFIKFQWQDLQSTQPDLLNFQDTCEQIESLLENTEVSILEFNSKTEIGVNYNSGFNIIIGGNSLGRGVTFPCLQVVYYCRRSKAPQADTLWQHSRVFGYDRVSGLIRIFLPESLHSLFSSLNESNRLLIGQVVNQGMEGIQLIYSKDINPTRKNVLDKKVLNTLMGGVNFFPRNPNTGNVLVLDHLLAEFNESNESYTITESLIIELLTALGEYDPIDWDKQKFLNCITGVIHKRPAQKFTLIIRRDRDIAKGTGTMLAPNDRKLGDVLSNHVVLTLYRNNGNVSKGWKGDPFWMPNIKFPNDVCFFDTVNIDA